jgi:hypothetical protein
LQSPEKRYGVHFETNDAREAIMNCIITVCAVLGVDMREYERMQQAESMAELLLSFQRITTITTPVGPETSLATIRMLDATALGLATRAGYTIVRDITERNVEAIETALSVEWAFHVLATLDHVGVTLPPTHTNWLTLHGSDVSFSERYRDDEEGE